MNYCAQCGTPVPTTTYGTIMGPHRRNNRWRDEPVQVYGAARDTPELAVLCGDCNGTDEAWDLIQWIASEENRAG